MGQPYIGEIRMFAGNFAPSGWSFCDGSILSISQYEPLFALIGTYYGGDGVSTFALPNLLGRVPIHQGVSTLGNSYVLGQFGGLELVTLATNQLPAHTHTAAANNGTSGTPTDSPQGSYWSGWAGGQYSTTAPSQTMSPVAIGNSAGGSSPHDNMIPYQAISFIISLFGVFPSQG